MSETYKTNGSFENWFNEQDMPIDIAIMKIEEGFLRKKEITPILREGARFAWDFKQKEIEKLKTENENLKEFANRIFKNRKSVTLGMPFELCQNVERLLQERGE